jgi:hypothetical protein
MITDFPKLPLRNLGGLASFQFAPTGWIQSLPSIINGVITQPPSFYGGIRFYSGISTLEKLVFEEEAAPDANGTAYNWKITGFYPGDDLFFLQLLQTMSLPFHTYLLVIRDYQGRYRMVGYDAPLTFTYSFTSGTRPGEVKGYSFTFAGSGKNAAPAYKL